MARPTKALKAPTNNRMIRLFIASPCGDVFDQGQLEAVIQHGHQLFRSRRALAAEQHDGQLFKAMGSVDAIDRQGT